MAYTVKQLAKLSEVSVRTLHFYDEIGLLKPAYHGGNGYRFYEEEQLLMLQQILFFRELGFELKKIQKILGRPDFDKAAALHAHRKVLQQDLIRVKGLIETIDKTIDHLKGEKKMKDQEMYFGFSKEKQAEYLTYLKNRLGEDHYAFAESEEKGKNWTKDDFEKFKLEWEAICKALAALMEKSYREDSREVQSVIQRHFHWICRAWTPNRESYIGLGQGYTGFEWKKAFASYDPKHPRLALFLAEGMRVFAEQELS